MHTVEAWLLSQASTSLGAEASPVAPAPSPGLLKSACLRAETSRIIGIPHDHIQIHMTLPQQLGQYLKTANANHKASNPPTKYSIV